MFVTPEKSKPKTNLAMLRLFFVQTDLHGVILSVSDTFSRTAGKPVSALINSSLFNYFNEIPEWFNSAGIEQLISSQQPAVCEVSLLVNYEIIPVQWNISATRPGNAAPAMLEWYGTSFLPGNTTHRSSLQTPSIPPEKNGERYSSFIQQVAYGIWCFELKEPCSTALPASAILAHCARHGYLAECNEAFAVMHGYADPASVIESAVTGVIPFAYLRNAGFLENFVNNGFRLDGALSSEKGKNGAIRTFISSLTGIVNGGKLHRIWGIQRDVTSQQEEEAKQRLKLAMIDHFQDSISCSDLDMKVTAWNKGAETLYGINEKDILGKRAIDFVDISYHGTTREAVVKEIFRTGGWSGEFSFLRRTDGSRRTALSTISLVYDNNNQPSGMVAINKDITDRKSELFYRSLIADSLDGIVLTDTGGIIRFIAPSVKNTLGYDQEGLLGKSMFEVVHPEDIEVAKSAFREEVNRTARVQQIHIRLLHQDGRWVWCAVRGHNLTHNSSVQSMVIYFNDDSRRKKIEDALRESEQRFRLLSENSKDIICLHRKDGTLIYVSPSAEQVLGYPAEMLTGQNPFDYIHPDDSPLTRQGKGKQGLRQFITGTVRFRFRKKEGGYTWLETTTQPVYSEEKKIISLQTISRDITERVQVLHELERKEQELLRVNERFELATRAATDIIWEMNLSSGYSYFAPEFAERFGYATTDMQQNPAQWYVERLHPEDRLPVVSKLTSAFSRHEKFWRDEFRWRCKDGSYRYIYNRSYLFYDEKGIPCRAIGAIQDITERKKAESQLIQKDILLAASVQAANELLASTDLEQALKKSLRIIGIAAKVDRTYIFQYLYDEKKQGWFYRQSHEWNSGTYEAQINNPELQLLYEERFPEITAGLKDGQPRQLQYSEEMRAPLKNLLQAQHIKSLLLVPVFVQGAFRGFVGFDECTWEREWTNTELDILKAFASNISGTLERKEAGRKLAESEIKFKSLFRNSLDIVIVLDEELNTRFVTPSVKAVLGFEEYAVTGKKGFRLIHPSDRHKAVKFLRELLENLGQSPLVDIRMKNREGKWIWMEAKGINKMADPIIKGLIISFRDISDRKLSEQQLQDYSAHITNILNSITDGFIALDYDFRVLWWNQIATRLTGVKDIDILGRNLWESFPELKKTKALAEYEKARATKTVSNFELYLETLDLYFDVNAYPSQQGVFVYFKDITEKKRQEMLQSLEKAVLEINANTSASLKTTVDYFMEGLEQLNRGMLCSVLLLEDDGKTLYQLSAPGLPKGYIEAIDGMEIGPGAGSCGTSMYLQKTVIVPDVQTDPLWYNYRSLAATYGLAACWSFPIITSNNRVLGAFAVYYSTVQAPAEGQTDILSRAATLLGIIIENKQAEAKINISNERYLLATRATNDAIWDLDMRTNYLYWGESFYTLFGYKPSQVQGRGDFWASRLHPDDRKRVVKVYEDTIAGKVKEIVYVEYRFQKANGKYAVVADRAFMVFDSAGNPTRFVGSMQDITERKKLEKKLLKQEIDKQKLVAQAVVDAQEKERAEIGKELHDNVNQILSTAKLYLELAKSDERQRQELIERSADSIFNAINEIRAISRALVPPSVKDLGLVDSVNDLVESLKMTRKLQVKFNCSSDVENKMSDKQKLMLFRIIQEQVSNVLKHAEAEKLVIDMAMHDNMIALTISDNGKGFDPDHMSFKQGLGLSNIKSRANLFNGKVTVNTAPGKGCKLFVQVPIHSEIKP